MTNFSPPRDQPAALSRLANGASVRPRSLFFPRPVLNCSGTDVALLLINFAFDRVKLLCVKSSACIATTRVIAIEPDPFSSPSAWKLCPSNADFHRNLGASVAPGPFGYAQGS
jgi:hypothetical protein